MNADSAQQWVKSSYSGNGGNSCVEWAPASATTGIIPVRDSKDTSQPALAIPTHAWKTFVTHLKS